MKKIAVGLALIIAFSPLAVAQDVFALVPKGDSAAIKALLEKSPELIRAVDANGDTLLHHAAARGNVELVRFLLEKGAAIDLPGSGKHTPLQRAALNDRTDAVAVLLEKKASLELKNDYGRTALVLCARERGQAKTARLLIEAGADVNTADRFASTPLELAAWRGKREFVDLLLAKGARLPELGAKWLTILSLAAEHGLEALFIPLAEKSKDLKSAVGEDFLSAAAKGGSPVIIGRLLEMGFDPRFADAFGWTPLHYAARDGRVEALRTLIAKGAPLDARTLAGQSAYNVAKERGYEDAAALLVAGGADPGPARFPVLEGDYLGQKPPADKPEMFAPGIISSIWGLHSAAVFSPDGNEVYWAPMVTRPGGLYSETDLLMMKRVGGRWTPPEPASFSGKGLGADVPFLSPDGKRVYFLSRRPRPGETAQGSEKIWYADRTASGWGEPKILEGKVNEHNMHWEFSLGPDGTVYFAGSAPDSLGLNDIYRAKLVNGAYEAAENVGPPISSAMGEDGPFIAPDGSYLLFSRQYDLWISFAKGDGTWGDPVKLGPEVNSPSIDLCPVVTADGKYLFFLSQRGGESHVYWVRAGVLDKYRQPRPGAAGGDAIVFYSGRNDNKDVYLLRSGEKEPRNLTSHPAADLCPAPSPDGRRIAFLSDRSGAIDIYDMAVDGGDVRRLTASPETEEHPEYAPDGERILFVRDFGARTEIWIMDADGANPRRLTANQARDERPFMSPDGSRILFMSNRDGRYQIYAMDSDGGRQARLVETEGMAIFPVWSPDGSRIAYARKFRTDGRMQGMIRVMNADGSSDRALTAVETRDENVMWSPDGRAIVFQSVRDGNFEIYRANADGSDPVRLTDHPAWDGWACFVPSGKRR
jgi:TolB protein